MADLTPEEFVTALYRDCLGREADREGLAYWSDQVRQHGKTQVFEAILASAEYHNKHQGITERCNTIATSAHRALDRPLRIIDVGAQLLGANPYDPLAPYRPLEIIGFDPLEERLAERADAEGKDGITLLPYAIGDGGSHTLYINNDDATTSLFPLDQAFNAHFNHLSTLRTVSTHTLETKRLDDVLPSGSVDFLKLDVQGAELMILQASLQTLAKTAVVHCEVEFSPIYAGQPLYPEIQQFLDGHRFELIDILVPGRYHYVTDQNAVAAPDRLIGADAVFFRVTDNPDTLRAQALIAAAVYGKPTLAAHLLRSSD